MQITNCHIHTFTAAHVPARFAGILSYLIGFRPARRALLFLLRHVDPFSRRDLLERHAAIVETAHSGFQKDVFARVRGSYPPGTRFVVLPMDMEHMGAGKVKVSIDAQHEELKRLRDSSGGQVIPFVAADPRRGDMFEKATKLLADGFRGIKLYPPLGYWPNDPELLRLYAFAAEGGFPVMSHCSRGGVYYRGKLTEEMLTHPVTGEKLKPQKQSEFTDHFADPDNYVPILRQFPKLRICLAHLGGAGDWERFLTEPWDAASPNGKKSWLGKILDLIRSGEHESLYTDISYTLFARADYVHVLKVFLADERVRRRVLFGSDFYLVEQAKLEERRGALRIRSVLGEELFRTIAEENPRAYLGEP